MRPLHPVSPGLRTVLGISFFVLFIAFWAWITLGGHVNRIFLADPLSMLRDGWRLLVEDRFWLDILITIWRVFGGFLLASVVAVPLGIAMGAWKPVEAFLEPTSRTSYFTELAQSSRDPAMLGKLARLSADVTAPGGLLMLASCSHNIPPERFAQECAQGLLRAGRRAAMIHQAGAGPDHPVHPLLPESAYLKAIVYALD